MNDRVYLRSELRDELGMARREIRHQAKTGTLRRVRRGAWALPAGTSATAETDHRLLVEAVARQRSAPVFSHASAAVLWGLPVDRALLACAWVTRPKHGRRRRDVIEKEAPLLDESVTTTGEVTLTTVARTLVDLCCITSLEWGVAALDAALHKALCTPDAVHAEVEAARRRRGVQKALAALRLADRAAESPLESVSRVSMVRAGVPLPQLQRIILDHTGDEIARVDFCWEEYKLVGECDGAIKYGQLLQPGQTPQAAVLREKQREERIRDAGYWIVRWDWATAWQPLVLGQRIKHAAQWQQRQAS